jgi:DNA-binding helix-hairpin-helix protein with protein kinase domain
VDWEPAGRHGWSISLRCPECEWRDQGVFSQEIADRFDDALDASTQAVLGDYQALVRANMENDVERFLKALETDLILPEDF